MIILKIVKKILAAFLSALVFSVTPLVFAEETSTASSPTPTPATTTNTSKEAVRETVKERVKTRKEKAETKIENIREKIASKEAALMEKLAKFKDTKKANVVERVNTNLNKINTNQTDHMAKFLENATKILDRLQAWVTEKAGQGKDTTAANSAITDARNKIASASSAVSAQAAKDYTVSISSESAAKADIKTQRNNLHTDLLGIRKQVIEAKQAVANAIRMAKTTLGGENGN